MMGLWGRVMPFGGVVGSQCLDDTPPEDRKTEVGAVGRAEMAG